MTGWERSLSPLPVSEPPPIQLQRSKPNDVVKLDDLPDSLLLEILCRLPSKEFVFQCKCVSKRWCDLISDPFLIGRFVYHQQYHKKTPVAKCLIDFRGKDYFYASSRTKPSSSPCLLDPLFESLMSFYGLEEKLNVVGTSNDLVLCYRYVRVSYDARQGHFYICNPCTRQWAALPPITQCANRCLTFDDQFGFICDRYYENSSADTTRTSSKCVTVDKEYRCRVVRIINPHNPSNEFIVDVFSSETGEWRKTLVSSPRSIKFSEFSEPVAYNGMLYWTYHYYDPSKETGVIGLDPFVMNNGSASSRIGSPNGGDEETVYDDGQYEFHLFDAREDIFDYSLRIFVRRGCLQMWSSVYDGYEVWELTDLGSAEKPYLKKLGYYPLEIDDDDDDDDEYPIGRHIYEICALDPIDEDILYIQGLGRFGFAFTYNIRTRTSLFVSEFHAFGGSCILFLLELPWWPTPIPKLLRVEEE